MITRKTIVLTPFEQKTDKSDGEETEKQDQGKDNFSNGEKRKHSGPRIGALPDLGEDGPGIPEPDDVSGKMPNGEDTELLKS